MIEAASRSFHVDPNGTCLLVEFVLTTRMSEAMDILRDYTGYLPEKWVSLLWVAENDGMDPVVIARKLVEFNRIAKTYNKGM